MVQPALIRRDLKQILRLAVKLQNGEGMRRNLEAALKVFKLAAEMGDSDAQFSVGIYLRDGVGTKTDAKGAIRWFQASADQGNSTGIYCLGLSYFEGNGVRRDLRKATALFEEAAKRGDKDAARNLKLLRAESKKAS